MGERWMIPGQSANWSAAQKFEVYTKHSLEEGSWKRLEMVVHWKLDTFVSWCRAIPRPPASLEQKRLPVSL